MQNELAIPESSFRTCSNCAKPTALRYCSHCGQKQRTPDDYRLLHFLGHVIKEFTSLDNKVLISLKHLFTSPGKLTVEWTEGRERRYVRPLQLFVIANVFYFLFTHLVVSYSTFTAPLYVQYWMQFYSPYIQPIVKGILVTNHLGFDQFEKVYDEVSAEQARSLIIIMIPMFSILVAILNIRKNRYFVEHLVFSLNFYSFFLFLDSIGLYLLTFLLRGYCAVFHIPWKTFNWDMSTTFIIGITLMVYLFVALQKVYKGRWQLTLLKSIVLGYSVLYIIFAYRFVLFFTTIYTIHLKAG